MAYKFTKGKVYRGDIYNEDDVQQNTYLDWSEDAFAVVTGDSTTLVVSSSAVGINAQPNNTFALDIPVSASTVRMGRLELGAWPQSTGYGFIGHSYQDHHGSGKHLKYNVLIGTAGDISLNSVAGQDMYFRIGTTIQAAIDSNGFFAIGPNAAHSSYWEPTAQLQVSSSDDQMVLLCHDGQQNPVLAVTGSGRVGIGTDSPEAYLDIKNTTDDGANNRTMIQLYNYRADDADTNDWAPTSIDFKIENVAGGVKGATARIATVIAPVGTGHNTTEGEKSSALIFSTMDDATLSEATRINNLGHVGIGTTSPESTLTVSGSVAAAITSFTGTSNALSAAHHTVLMGSDNNSCTVTLPAAAGCTGRIYVIKRIGSSGTYTIAPQSGETIDGNGGDFTAWSSDQNNIVMIQSDGSNWWILSEAHMGEGGG